MIVIRYQSGTENVATIIFYFSLFGTVGGAILTAICRLGPRRPCPIWRCLSSSGLIGGFGQYFMTLAFRLARNGGPSRRWTILHSPGRSCSATCSGTTSRRRDVFAGIALVTGSGLFILYREREAGADAVSGVTRRPRHRR